MKILFYNHTGQASGAEYLLLMILARLDRTQFESVVVCPETGPLQTLVNEIKIPVESVEGLNARFTSRPDRLLAYLKSFVKVIRDLRQQVLKVQPDAIHANSIRAGIVATAATVGMNQTVVWHLHDLLPRHPISTLIRVFARAFSRTRMIAVSQAVADNFIGRVSGLKARTTAILNGIDLSKFKSIPNARDEIRNELGIDANQIAVGIVGQLTPRKGQLELIRAFKTVCSEVPQSALLIVGAALFNRDEEYAQRLKDEAIKLGIAERVKFTGARKDVSKVMQSLDLLVVNSSTEPFGLVALEALACGTPVLAAISGGIPELIDHGKSGWLVTQGDESELAQAMLHLCRHPEIGKDLAARGQQHMRSRFSAERYLTEFEGFYSSLDNLRSEYDANDVVARRSLLDSVANCGD